MQLYNPLCAILNSLLLCMVWTFKIFALALLTHHFLVSQQVETQRNNTEWKPSWQLYWNLVKIQIATMTQIHFHIIMLSKGIQYELPWLSCRCSSFSPIFSTVYLVYCNCDTVILCDATTTGLRHSSSSSSSALQPWVSLDLLRLRQWYHDFSTRWCTTIYPGLCLSWNFDSWQINRKHGTHTVAAASFISEVIRFWSEKSWGIFLQCLTLCCELHQCIRSGIHGVL